MTEELYFKLLEASLTREGYSATILVLVLILAGLIALMICSGICYYSADYRCKPNTKFSKLFYPSTFITVILLVVFVYNVKQCASYPTRYDVERMIKDLDKIKKINSKAVENN